MSGSRYIGASAAFSLALTAIVIISPGYYESPGLLMMMQIAFIFCPAMLPFLVLLGASRRKIPAVTCAALLVLGWVYVVYVDTRQYEGGGASFAILFGWAASVASAILAAVLVAASHTGQLPPDSGWRRPPSGRR